MLLSINFQTYLNWLAFLALDFSVINENLVGIASGFRRFLLENISKTKQSASKCSEHILVCVFGVKLSLLIFANQSFSNLSFFRGNEWKEIFFVPSPLLLQPKALQYDGMLIKTIASWKKCKRKTSAYHSINKRARRLLDHVIPTLTSREYCPYDYTRLAGCLRIYSSTIYLLVRNDEMMSFKWYQGHEEMLQYTNLSTCKWHTHNGKM